MLASFFYVLERYIPTLLSAIFVFYYAKRVDVNFFGEVSFFLSIAGALSIFTFESIDQLLQKEIIKKPTRLQDYINTIISIKLISTISAVIIAFVCILFISKNKVIFFLILLLPIITNSFNSIRSIFIVNNYFSKQIMTTFPAVMISFVLKMVIVYEFEEDYLLIICFVLDSIFINLFLYLRYIKEHTFTFSIDMTILKHFIAEGKYLIFSGATLLLYANIDQILIGNLLTKIELANYSVAIKLLSMYLIASTVFNLGFVKLLNFSDDNLDLNCKKMLVFSVLIGTAFSIVNFYFSPLFLDIIFGEKFKDAAINIKLLTPIILFSFLLSSTGRILVTKRLSKFAFYRNIHALWINIIFSYVGCLYLGVLGIILGTVLSFFVSSVGYLILNTILRREFKKILLS